MQITENEELQNNPDEIKRYENFYETFSDKLVIFDPLDRPIPAEHDNQALK